MRPAFSCSPLSRLELWLDPEPRSAAANMAIDEFLLRSAPPFPVLRLYRWSAPAVSFGYFQRWAEIAAGLPPGVEAIRRWTGGGLVDHRNSTTYSLVAPATSMPARVPVVECYCWVHQGLAAALRSLGWDCDLAPASNEPPAAAGRCFAGGHAKHDVLASGRKIAGAAQRRNRLGLLHQGSIAMERLPEAFAWGFAEQLAGEITPFQVPAKLEAGTAELVAARYGRLEWLHQR